MLIFTSEFPPQPGGIGNHAWNLACEMQRRGVEVRLITDGRLGGAGQELEFDAKAPFTVLRIPFGRAGIRQLRRIFLYLKQLKAWSPDVLVASGRFPLLLAARVPTRALRVAVLHGTEAGAAGSAVRKATTAAVQQYRVLIPVSRFTRNYFEIDSSDARATVIPNGVPTDRFSRESSGNDGGCPSGSPRLITVGNVTGRKGQDNVIRALPSVLKRYPNAVYHVAGIPTQRDAFLELARKLGVAEHVVFHGAVSEAVLGDLLRSADVFLMLSAKTDSGDVEGFGIAVLEANLLGVPAVGSTGCGIEDAIEDGESGILVDPMDTDAVAEAVHSVIEAREAFSAGAIAWVARHSWQNIGARYEKSIESAMLEVPS